MMVFIYLVALWLLFTAVWSGSAKLRKNGAVFLVWFALTAVTLWPVARRLYESPELRAIADEVRSEWAVELEKEFGRPVSVEKF